MEFISHLFLIFLNDHLGFFSCTFSGFWVLKINQVQTKFLFTYTSVLIWLIKYLDILFLLGNKSGRPVLRLWVIGLGCQNTWNNDGLLKLLGEQHFGWKLGFKDLQIFKFVLLKHGFGIGRIGWMCFSREIVISLEELKFEGKLFNFEIRVRYG